MLAALACLRYRIEPHIVCYGRPPAGPRATCGCIAGWAPGAVHGLPGGRRWTRHRGVTAELRAAGRRPYPVPGGATRWARSVTCGPAGNWPLSCRPGSAAGRVVAGHRVLRDQAGLLAGVALTGAACQVVGRDDSRPRPNAAAGSAAWPPRPPRWPAGTRPSRSPTSGTAGSGRGTVSRRPPGGTRPGWSR